MHGPGKYDPTGYDEKRNRPPKGSYTVRRERITFVEEALWRGSESPGIYNPIEVVSKLTFCSFNINSGSWIQDKITRRPVQQVKMRPDSEKQIEVMKRQEKKDNSPSPTCYRADEAFEKLSGSPS